MRHTKTRSSIFQEVGTEGIAKGAAFPHKVIKTLHLCAERIQSEGAH
jgi:hypothetical protein